MRAPHVALSLAGVLAVAGALAGCGPGRPADPAPPPAAVAEPEPEPEAEPRAFATAAVEAEARDPQRRRMWTIRAERARLDVGADRKSVGDLEVVRGTIYADGAATSTFRAARGRADQAAQVLRLAGDVVVVAQDPPAELRADAIRWNAGAAVLEAEGRVRVVTPDYEIGPFPRLMATPDLRTVATPDRFPEQP